MHILITGGTGFVGRPLTRYLLDRGHTVTTVGRSATHPCDGQPGFHHIAADTTREGDWQNAVSALSGGDQSGRDDDFPTLEHHRQTRNPRQPDFDHPPSGPGDCRRPGRLFVFSASGVGFYGDGGDQALTEDTAAGDDFLARLSIDWEKEAMQAEARGVRVAIGRFGVILHQTGGALSKMLPAFRMGVGGPLGNGRQWFPWIHLDDLMAAIEFLIGDTKARGPFNFCAPEPVTNRQLARTLGRRLGRPSFFPAPAPLMRLVLGEFSEVLLGSQRTLPQRLQDHGFVFRYPTIDTALKAIIDAR